MLAGDDAAMSEFFKVFGESYDGPYCFSDCAGEYCAGVGKVASCMDDCGGKLLLYRLL